MSTDPSSATVETDAQTPAASDHGDQEEPSSSSSTSSEDIDEDNCFQIEGPLLSTQFSLSVPAEGSSLDAETDQGHGTTNPQQPPPVQAMSGASDKCLPDQKRIPSSVFARSKSTTPTEWSITSNESLFSINIGNASFSKDHLFLYGKSGELGNLNDPLAPLPPLPRQSPGSSPIKGEVVAPRTTSEEEQQGSAIQAKPSAPRDGEESADYIHSLSHRSDGSTSTSFAFPILAGDVRFSGPLKDNHVELTRQSTAQMIQPEEPLAKSKETPKAQMEAHKAAMEAPKVEEAHVPVPAQASVPAPTQPPRPPASAKWFPWCSCCPFCC